MKPKTGKTGIVSGKSLEPGDLDYRAFVGPAEHYDTAAALQFNLLTSLGLREHHYLVDIGCGSLRAGRLFIPYLRKGHYYGIEPEKWLVDEGVKNELGTDALKVKAPVFSYDDGFAISAFRRKFDFLLAHSIFSHAPRPVIEKCIDEAQKSMKKSSIFVVTYAEGEIDYAGDRWVYPGEVTYSFAFMKKIISKAGLKCKKINWPHHRDQKWLLIYHP